MATTETVSRIAALEANLARALLGKSEAIRQVVVALLAEGHVLIEDVPGVGKTVLARALAASIEGKFTRLQCTPDLLPSDILGTGVFLPQAGDFEFRPGPIFTNVLLADEVNRTTPRTQSALLEAMNERQVSVDGITHALPNPFVLVATQNPYEYEGTYPLPEAQLDRFLFKQVLDYPSLEQERAIVAAHGSRTGLMDPVALGVEVVADAAVIDAAVNTVADVRLTDEVIGYITGLVRATRTSADVETGASPRAGAMLAVAARARAALDGRDYVIPDDVKA